MSRPLWLGGGLLLGLLLGVVLTVVGSVLDWPRGWFGNLRKLWAAAIRKALKLLGEGK